ncbi:MAG TPA: 2-C-methyl-D-erythritol 4-phosphate cytidylyltransferase [Candidatus Acidoferrum sp.]|nr:2-C-methyl-D-erythritol 4-phosphate cytidylyltransferase [Candidatus Acidoferrum sp.]
MSVAAIVVAGGAGTRMRSEVNKVFIEVHGRSLLEWSLALFQEVPVVTEMVIVSRQADLERSCQLARRYGKLSSVVVGGDVRHRSEFAGIKALAASIDGGRITTVLVHDAVRPFASRRLVERVVVGIDEAVGCIPGLRVPGTVVEETDGWVSGYPENLWAVQTPQAFQATWLLEAHNKAARQGFIGSDTASVVEWAGGDVKVIEGENNNIKITSPEDLGRAEQIAAGFGG